MFRIACEEFIKSKIKKFPSLIARRTPYKLTDPQYSSNVNSPLPFSVDPSPFINKISLSDYYKLTFFFLKCFVHYLLINIQKLVMSVITYMLLSKVRSVKPNWPRIFFFAISLSVDISRIFKMFLCIQTIFDCNLQEAMLMN